MILCVGSGVGGQGLGGTEGHRGEEWVVGGGEAGEEGGGGGG